VDTDLVLQLIVSGLAIGIAYGLIGLGLSLVFGVLNLINFAHGEFYMLGAFVIYTLVNLWGIPYLVAIPLTALVLAAFGWLITATYVEPLVKTSETAMLIGTLGVSYVLLEVARIIWGADQQQIQYPWRGETLHLLGDSRVPLQQIFTGAVGIVCTIVLVIVVYRTRYGRYMRAVAENPAAAGLCGINVKRIYRMTFAIGTAVAALAGSTAGAINAHSFLSGQQIVLKAFVVVIIAGLGNIPGAITAGLLLGLVETLGGGLISPDYQNGFGYLLLVLVLLVRPDGLLARRKVAT
jgi:branched-chain amino acid transport system permease protein